MHYLLPALTAASAVPTDMDGRDAEALRLIVAHLYRERQLFVTALTSAYAAFVVTVWWRRLAVPRRYKGQPQRPVLHRSSSSTE